MLKKKKEIDKVALSEKEVLEKLDIPNFKRMGKDKITDFCKMIPNMETGVMRSAFEQFPDFAKTSTAIMIQYKEMVGTLAKENSTNMKSFNESCDLIISYLGPLIQKRRIKRKERKEIIDTMMQVLQMKSEKDKDNKNWLSRLAVTASAVAASLAMIVSVIVGIDLVNKK